MADEQSPGEMPTPLVSVLIPAYNHERFVQRCLDSVLEDPYPAKELVIIDDGSTDRTGEKIAEWVEMHRGELPVQYVRRDNKGIAATLNELAVRAHGQFLRPGASDDYLLPGGIEAQVRYLLAHPDKGAVVGDSVVIDAEGRKIHDSGMCDLHHADKALYCSDKGIRRAVISQWAVGGPVALIRKSALETGARWSEGLRIDDWDLFLGLAANHALGFIDVSVCAYRIHGTNLSRTRHRTTRVVNLAESRQVALRKVDMFEEPYRSLLKAQSYYIGAKIAFLERRPLPLLFCLAAYGSLLMASKLRLAAVEPGMEEA